MAGGVAVGLNGITSPANWQFLLAAPGCPQVGHPRQRAASCHCLLTGSGGRAAATRAGGWTQNTLALAGASAQQRRDRAAHGAAAARVGFHEETGGLGIGLRRQVWSAQQECGSSRHGGHSSCSGARGCRVGRNRNGDQIGPSSLCDGSRATLKRTLAEAKRL